MTRPYSRADKILNFQPFVPTSPSSDKVAGNSQRRALINIEVAERFSASSCTVVSFSSRVIVLALIKFEEAK